MWPCNGVAARRGADNARRRRFGWMALFSVANLTLGADRRRRRRRPLQLQLQPTATHKGKGCPAGGRGRGGDS